MKRIMVLVVNPVCKAKDYEIYFQCSKKTAQKYLSVDKLALNKERITYMDFFNNYGAFPAPWFKPEWKDLDVPICAN